MLEDIESKLINLISSTFYTSKDKTSLCIMWNRTNVLKDLNKANYMQEDINEPRILGLELIFDIIAFTSQLTTDPDPIKGINEWTKTVFEESLVIANDILPELWKPIDTQPAIYWRLLSLSISNKNSYSVTWYKCQIKGHVIGSITETIKWLKLITEELSIAGEVMLADKSPMLINNIVIKNDADRLKEGQLTIIGTFGVLNRKENKVDKLMNTNFN